MKGFTKLLTAGAVCCGLLLSSSSFAVQSVLTKRHIVVDKPNLMVITFAKSPLEVLSYANDYVNLCVATANCNNVSIHNVSPYKMRVNWNGKDYSVASKHYLEFTVARNYHSDFWVALVRPDNMMKKYNCQLRVGKISCP